MIKIVYIYKDEYYSTFLDFKFMNILNLYLTTIIHLYIIFNTN